MKIKYLNGKRLKQIFTAGSIRLIEQRDYLNDINVYPVPDGDTGTNMAGTIEHIVDDISQSSEMHIGNFSTVAAQSALMGAKGNSGTILAQFINGIAIELKDKIRINAVELGQAVKKASDYTYNSVSNPKEGTILTVIREWSSEVELWSRKTSDISTIHKKAFRKASEALANTKKQLAALKKADVIDAGAQGFVHFLEGMHHFFSKEHLLEFYRKKIKAVKSKAKFSKRKKNNVFSSDFQFCTEALIASQDTDLSILRERLSNEGDSLIVAGGAGLIKVHIHTNDPERIFSIASEFGSIEKTKIDDMKAQVHSSMKKKGSCAIVTDSACDLPQQELDKYGIQMVPAILYVDGEAYKDKEDISSEEFIHILNEQPDISAGTSQPAIGEFVNKFRMLAQHFESIIYIGVSKITSGTFSAGVKAVDIIRKELPEIKISTVNSKNGSIGLGLLIRKAARMAEQGFSGYKIVASIRRLREHTFLAAVLPNLNRTVSGGRLSERKASILNFLKLKPVIKKSRAGHLGVGSLYFGKKRDLNKIFQSIKKQASGLKKLEFMIAHSGCVEMAIELQQRLLLKFKEVKDISICLLGPALTAHTGADVLAVAVTGEK
jgi:DAK2 domain fusion protein YloV